MCEYGAACYRKNPRHFLEKDHPAEHPLIGSSGNGDGSASTSSEQQHARGSSAPPPPSAPSATLGWRNNTIHAGWVASGIVPARANEDTCSIADLLSATELADVTELHLHNFMIDMDWIASECPAILSVPRIVVLHGKEHDVTESHVVHSQPHRFTCLQPPCERFGTHHSKALFLVRPNKLTIHVTTANFIFGDWHNKTNGIWSKEFPARDSHALPSNLLGPPMPDTFERDLFDYYHGVRSIGINPPPQWAPQGRSAAWAALDLRWIRRYDYSRAAARLAAAIPGRHTGAALHAWGHMAMRKLIDLEPLASHHHGAPLVLQFSSLSSVGNNTTWLRELVRSFCGPASSPSRVEVIYPTQEQVQLSLEGWYAGTSIPCEVCNAEKCKERLSELTAGAELPMTTGAMCGWDGGDGAYGGASGRERAVPHIKTFCRYDPQSRSLAWALLGSHNLSQAAWGKLEKNSTQLYVKSYELGVLLLPSLLRQPAATDGAEALHAPAQLYAPARTGGNTPLAAGSVVVPLPYSLPPVPYTASDVVWSTHDSQALPRTQTAAPADRHGYYPGEPGQTGYYGPRAFGKVVAEAAASRARHGKQPA